MISKKLVSALVIGIVGIGSGLGIWWMSKQNASVNLAAAKKYRVSIRQNQNPESQEFQKAGFLSKLLMQMRQNSENQINDAPSVASNVDQQVEDEKHLETLDQKRLMRIDRLRQKQKAIEDRSEQSRQASE